MGALARTVPAAAHVRDYASRLVIALQPWPAPPAIVRDNVRLGPSPRGAQALTLAGNVSALLDGGTTSRSRTCAPSRCRRSDTGWC